MGPLGAEPQGQVLPADAARETEAQGRDGAVARLLGGREVAEYRVEVSTDPAFGSIDQDSGWIAALSTNFTGLLASNSAAKA